MFVYLHISLFPCYRCLWNISTLNIIDMYSPAPLPDVLCDPTDLNWRKRTPCEAMTGRTVKGTFINYVRVPREGVGKISTYSYFGEGRSNPFLRNIFQIYIILEITRPSGLARIIFHLRLEGKKRIRMSCFLLFLFNVKLEILV